MKYKQFIELVQDDDIDENIELCVEYLKYVYTRDKNNKELVKHINRHNDAEYFEILLHY